MTDKFVMSSRLAAELDHAFERNNFSAADVKLLSKGNTLSLIRDVLQEYSEIVELEHYIDLNARPFVPKGWQICSYREGGQFKWDASKVQLYLDPIQKGKSGALGREIYHLVTHLDHLVLNANVLDYLLSRPHIIPESWKSFSLYFWGTLYHDETSNVCVRYLIWRGDKWDWASKRLYETFHGTNYAALVAVGPAKKK